jgi:hypothetical protein
MQEKFKFILIFIFLSIFSVFPKTNEKSVAFVLKSNDKLSDKSSIIINFLIDAVEEKIKEENKNILIKETNETFDINSFVKITNFLQANSLDAFYFIDAFEESKNITITVNLYSFQVKPIFIKKFIIEENDIIDNENFLKDEKIREWLALIDDSLIFISKTKMKIPFRSFTNKSQVNDRDFPFININISAVSSKISFDDRAILYSFKTFSFFPFDFRLSFYPLRYLETGLFFEVNYDNLVLKYYDADKDIFSYFDVGVVLNYGMFLGASFFNQEKFHYSLGLQFYNLYYDTSRNPDWQKTNDASSFFLPQFSFYQKIDFNIIKFFYLSILVNLKTYPKMYLSDNYFYSRPFYYDFFYLEFSLIGVSLVF